MNKYVTLFGLSWQKQLEVRSDFIFERGRALSLLIAQYFLWTSLLANQQQVAGYDRASILTYILMASFLRALVLACVSDRMPIEIAKGNLSDLLLRPISPIGYWAVQDMASKSLNMVSAFFELSVFMLLLRPPVAFPGVVDALAFSLVTVGSMILYFQMSYLLGIIGFWTAQSWGPRFCFEVILEFCAGVYFPLDVLPKAAQVVLSYLPFPYLIYQPLQLFLGRLSPQEIMSGLLIQWVWIAILGLLIKKGWAFGLQVYAAEGR